MTKPDDIPQDVLAQVKVWTDWYSDTPAASIEEAFARAIMAEREACARVAAGAAIRPRVKQSDAMEAEQPESHLLHALFASKLDETAAAIRNRGAAA